MDRKTYDAHRALADTRQVPPQHLHLEPQEAFSTLTLLAAFAAVVPWVVVGFEALA